jgi:hypothetical protein
LTRLEGEMIVDIEDKRRMNTTRAGQAAAPGRTSVTAAVSKAALVLLALVPIGFLFSTVFGAVRWYSPIPYADMWEGFVAFYLQFLNGQRGGPWFWQATDHLIVLTKLLFLLDARFFGGRYVLLYVANVVLLVLVWLTLCFFARRLFGNRRELWLVVSLLVAAPCLSWMQQQNITWAYQSGFFLVSLLPLAAFGSLAMAEEGRHRSRWFTASLAFGFCSLGTMGNGIAVMPLMLVMLLLMGNPPRWRIGALVLTGVVGIGLWYSQYTFLPRSEESAAQLVRFVLLFLGAPLAFLFGRESAGYLGGAVFIAASVWFAFLWMRDRSRHPPTYLGLLMMLVFIGATAAAASLSRASLGSDAALNSRYTTPVLLGWSVLVFLCADAWQTRRHARSMALAFGIVLAAALAPIQIDAFSDAGPAWQHVEMFGAIALKLGIEDPVVLDNLYPCDDKRHMDQLVDIAKRAAQARPRIPNVPGLDAAVDEIGAPVREGFHPCSGYLDQVDDLQGQSAYNRVHGWAFDQEAGRVPAFVYLAGDGVIVGVATTGLPRPDVARLVDRRGRYAGFSGYAKATAKEPSIVCANRP